MGLVYLESILFRSLSRNFLTTCVHSLTCLINPRLILQPSLNHALPYHHTCHSRTSRCSGFSIGCGLAHTSRVLMNWTGLFTKSSFQMALTSTTFEGSMQHRKQGISIIFWKLWTWKLWTLALRVPSHYCCETHGTSLSFAYLFQMVSNISPPQTARFQSLISTASITGCSQASSVRHGQRLQAMVTSTTKLHLSFTLCHSNTSGSGNQVFQKPSVMRYTRVRHS